MLPDTEVARTFGAVHETRRLSFPLAFTAADGDLLTVLSYAGLYVQAEVDIHHLPTLTWVGSRKGHTGQWLVRAPSVNRKAIGFVAVDWCDVWCAWQVAPRRTAATFVQQLDFLVERSQRRGRVAVALLDNLKIHTLAGAKKVGEALETHGAKPRLSHTPAYYPQANRIKRLLPLSLTALWRIRIGTSAYLIFKVSKQVG